MTFTEIVVTIVGFIVFLTGIFNFSLRDNRMLKNLIGETGYRILMMLIGVCFMYLAIFTNQFA